MKKAWIYALGFLLNKLLPIIAINFSVAASASTVEVEKWYNISSDNPKVYSLVEASLAEVAFKDRNKEKVTNVVLAILRANGFCSASVSVSVESEVLLSIKVTSGLLCVVREVEFNVDLDLKSSEGRFLGISASQSLIKTRLEELEEQLKNKGYKKCLLFIDKIETLAEGDTKLIIGGKVGKKIFFKVKEKDEIFDIFELIFAQTLDDLDPTIDDPNAIRAELEKLYYNKGYIDVIVYPAKELVSQDSIYYTFDIEKGQLYSINEVQFDGNKILSDDQLYEILGLENFWQIEIAFNWEELILGVDRIRAAYQRQGYWDVKVDYPRLVKDNKLLSLSIIYGIKEGQQRILDRFEFFGNKFFSTSELTALIAVRENEPIDRSTLLSLEEKIRNSYFNKGYSYCEIKVRVESRLGLTNIPTKVMVDIDEGPRVFVGTIKLVGLEKTNPKVVWREVLFHSGDWYDPENINKTRAALVNLGIFRSVQIVPKESDFIRKKMPLLDINIEVSEGNAGSISFGPGYKFQKGAQYYAELAYNNIGGEARKITIQGSISQEKDQYAISDVNAAHGKVFLGRKFSIGYVEPKIFELPIDGKVALSHLATADQIWKISSSLDFSLGIPLNIFDKKAEWNPFYNFQRSTDEGSKAQAQSLVSTGKTEIGRIGIRAKLDERDVISWPTAGYLIKIELAAARYFWGGSYEFLMWDANIRKYLSLPLDLVLDLGISATAYLDVKRKESDKPQVLPSSERLYAGGPNKVPGFSHQLGPYVDTSDGRETVGGAKRFIAQIELKKKFTDIVGMTFFVDLGNVFFTEEELRDYQNRFVQGEASRKVLDNLPYQWTDLVRNPFLLYTKSYVSYGAALSFISPIGPLNLSLSFPYQEPKTYACEKDGICFVRAKDKKYWFQKFQFDLNIGSEF